MKYYAVRKGKNTGIYESWAECKEQVGGFSGAEYKAFTLEAEAKEYLNKEDADHNIDNSLPYAYIDGSYSKSKNIYSYGGFIVNGTNTTIIQGTGNAADYVEYKNITGEVRGAIEVFKRAIEQGIKEINLFYDYAGIKYWACNEWNCNNKLTAYYGEYYNKRKHLLNVHFYQIKGHTGVEGNELADLLAKEVIGAKLTKKQVGILKEFKGQQAAV